ncbi:hypothetical protein M758_4G160500 [Ceratodon purpureus]|nr:hypothetical protein M758_4G160500 [Ceratodon purpureus]
MEVLDHLRSTIRRVLRTGMAMFLNKDSASSSNNSLLCETCKALDLVQIFRDGVRESEAIPIGALATILLKKDTCDLCALISHLISRSWFLDRHVNEDLTSVQVRLFAPLANMDVPHSAYPRRIDLLASRPNAIERTLKVEKVVFPAMALQLMENDAARFGRERLYHGRKVGSEVDFRLVKDWMRICETEHGPTCTDVWENAVEQLPEGARMVDVVEMAIVEAPANCRYVALSYIWGKINTEYVTVLKNVSQRCHRGSLNNVALPRTIGDAIKVVRKLGERYLWVDAMCIIQDDPDSKMAQIAGMANIYGAALVTIFAVGGDSADAPLPGLEPRSRQVQQQIKRIQELSLAIPLRMLEETLTASKWNTRGWTFQELVLSRRGLVFTKEQVFFRCQRDMFCEDVINEHSKDEAIYAGKHSFAHDELRAIRKNKVDLEYRYRSYSLAFMQIVEDYTRRELTNPADIYNAFFAIITLLSRYIEIPSLDPDSAFVFGMPESVLEDAMLFQPALNSPTHERRCEEGLVTPSWSWAGWMSSVVYFDLEGYGYNPVVAFQSLVDEWVIVDSKGRARQIASGRHLSEDDNPLELYKYQKPSIPSSASLVEEAMSLSPGTLLFYTTVALLWVRKVNNPLEESTAEEDPSDVRIYKSTSHSAFEIFSSETSIAKMGKIVLPTDTDVTVPLEFVVLTRSDILRGQGTYDEEAFGIHYEGCLLNVMVIKQVETTVDGKEVYERVGVGVIVETAWAASRLRPQVVRLQ